jgi:hypothetical protein
MLEAEWREEVRKRESRVRSKSKSKRTETEGRREKKKGGTHHPLRKEMI